jgi:uncharacterized protein
MNIDLNSFEREKAIDETLAEDSVDLELGNARISGPIRISGLAVKDSASVAMVGKLSGSVEIDCDRCLEKVERPFAIDLDIEFVLNQELVRDASLELLPDEMKLDAMDGSEIDLSEVARDQKELDLPQQFICSDDCKGLCEKCGTNLNLKDCDCKDDEIDPRWAVLKDLN